MALSCAALGSLGLHYPRGDAESKPAMARILKAGVCLRPRSLAVGSAMQWRDARGIAGGVRRCRPGARSPLVLGGVRSRQDGRARRQDRPGLVEQSAHPLPLAGRRAKAARRRTGSSKPRASRRCSSSAGARRRSRSATSSKCRGRSAATAPRSSTCAASSVPTARGS